MGPWTLLDGPVGKLQTYVTEAPAGAPGRPFLVLCHELPRTENGGAQVATTYPELADRIAQESGWRVATAALRGAGGSKGDFSPAGWLADLRFVLDHGIGAGERACLVGFGFGGALALRVAADDRRVGGVGILGMPDHLDAWIDEPAELVRVARRGALIHARSFPKNPDSWSAELEDLVPVGSALALEGRALLIVHGTADPLVDTDAAVALARAAGAASADLRVITGAGHWLRADPRAIATLIGWLERQR